jgi:predicted transcriptional regulator
MASNTTNNVNGAFLRRQLLFLSDFFNEKPEARAIIESLVRLKDEELLILLSIYRKGGSAKTAEIAEDAYISRDSILKRCHQLEKENFLARKEDVSTYPNLKPTYVFSFANSSINYIFIHLVRRIDEQDISFETPHMNECKPTLDESTGNINSSGEGNRILISQQIANLPDAGKEILKLANKSGITCTTVAEKTGLHVTTVYKYCKRFMDLGLMTRGKPGSSGSEKGSFIYVLTPEASDFFAADLTDQEENAEENPMKSNQKLKQSAIASDDDFAKICRFTDIYEQIRRLRADLLEQEQQLVVLEKELVAQRGQEAEKLLTRIKQLTES